MSASVNEPPLVSVHLGCYNHARFVREALESIKQQTYRHYELYIWDDCSKDNSVEVIAEWLRENPIRHVFVKNPSNLGLCRCLTERLRQAEGAYIAGMSADDIWMPDKMGRQVELFEKLPAQVGVVYSDALTLNDDGSPRPETMVEWWRNEHPVPPEGKVFKEILKYNFVTAPTVMFRRAVFERIGLYDESLPHEDFDMFLRIAREFEFRYMPDCLMKYRVTAGALNTKQDKIQPAKFRILKKWLNNDELTSEERTAVIRAMADTALKMYRLGLPEAPVSLAEAGALNSEQRLRWAAKAASCGVPFKVFAAGYRQLSRAKSLVGQTAGLR
jgi:glycosyltransferase involved in cell wall biosynthesis